MLAILIEVAGKLCYINSIASCFVSGPGIQQPFILQGVYPQAYPTSKHDYGEPNKIIEFGLVRLVAALACGAIWVNSGHCASFDHLVGAG